MGQSPVPLTSDAPDTFTDSHVTNTAGHVTITWWWSPYPARLEASRAGDPPHTASLSRVGNLYPTMSKQNWMGKTHTHTNSFLLFFNSFPPSSSSSLTPFPLPLPLL